MTDSPEKTHSPEKEVSTSPVETSTGGSLATFVAVALLLAAVVGTAWYMGSTTTNQANAPASETSATGTSTGDAGSDDSRR